MADWPENKLYVKWLESNPADRHDVEVKLYEALKRHVQMALWKKLKEVFPDELVDKATDGIMTQLGRFRKRCEFSTWVHEIAERNAKQYIRGKVASRKVFDEYVEVVESEREDALERRAREVTPSVLPQVEGELALRQWRESLSNEDATLLQHKEAGLTSKEIAEAMGTTAEAVDSRWARLKPRVKKFSLRRRK